MGDVCMEQKPGNVENISNNIKITSEAGSTSSLNLLTDDTERCSPYVLHSILTDSEKYHIKHPLQYHWTLTQKLMAVEGSSRGASAEVWQGSLKGTVTIGTVEDFWCLYNAMEKIASIPVGCDYFFFREGIPPVWENAANKEGYEIRVSVDNKMPVEKIWEESLLAIVGCQFTDWQIINGLQMANRKNRLRMAIWTGSCSKESVDRLRNEFAALIKRVYPEDLRFDAKSIKELLDGAHQSDHRGDRDRGDRGGRGGYRGGRGGGGRDYNRSSGAPYSPRSPVH